MASRGAFPARPAPAARPQARLTAPRRVAHTPALPRAAFTDAFAPGKGSARWEGSQGKWTITKEGRFAPTENPEFAYAFAGDLNWTDYILKADLINGQDAGLCVRAQDWSNCVLLVIRPGHRDLWWFVRRNGDWGGVLSPSTLPFGVKPVVKVKVEVTGDTFICYVNGKRVPAMKDATFRRGRIGLYLHPAEAGQAWDNVEVLLPPSPHHARSIAKGRS